nr:sugar-specific transcriptional regulator TrmB [Halorubrum sp. Ib24]
MVTGGNGTVWTLVRNGNYVCCAAIPGVSGTDGSDGPPPFEDVVASDDIEQRVYDTILQAREPTSVEAIADAADCDPETAQEHLTWFAELRIVTRHDGDLVTYERNDAYFDWRRVNELAATHSDAELRDRVRELATRISEYEERYDAASPAAVNAVAVAEASERSIDEVYVDLGDWATAQERRDLCERALRQATDDRECESG